MSLTNWTDWEVWLLDHDRKPMARLDDAKGFHLEIGAYGQGSFKFQIHPDSINADLIHAAVDEEQFIYAKRKTREFGGIVERVQKSYQPGADIQVSGCLISKLLYWPIMQPQNPATPGGQLTATGKADDAIKSLVKYSAVVGFAYADPDTNARGLAGFSVAADKAEHPDTVTLAKSGAVLGDEVRGWGIYYTIDYDVYPVWSMNGTTWVFETWYNGRGVDRSVTNGSNRVPVILSDVYLAVKEGDWYVDSSRFRTWGYTRNMSDVVARAGAANFYRREVVVQAATLADVAIAMQEVDRDVGYTFKFIESNALQCGTDFWLYDKITYHNRYLGTEVRHDFIAEIKFTIQTDGSEEIELVIGDPKPDQNKGGGGGPSNRRKPIEPPFDYAWALEDTDGAVAVPDVDNHVHVVEGSFINVTASGNDLTVAAKTHAHSLSGAMDGAGGHGHAVSGTTGSGSSHTHALSGNTGAGSSHDHALSGTSGAGSSHDHALSGTSAAGSSHNHDISGSTGSTQPSMSGATAAGGDASLTNKGFCLPTSGASAGEAHTHTYWVTESEHTGSTGTHTHGATGLACSSHAHDDGSLANAAEASHTHGIGSYDAAAEASHTHGIGSYDAAAESSHTHGLSGNVASGSSHTHGFADTADAVANHVHGLGTIAISAPA